jgi:hypothetical protein
MARLRATLLVVVIGLGALVVRVLTGSILEFHRGDQATVGNNPRAAMVHYERAVRWYLPGSPYAYAALGSLVVTCNRLAQEESKQAGFDCYNRARSAILSVRSFTTPWPRDLAAIDETIARLSGPLGYPTEKMREKLALRFEASPAWSLVAALGLVGWIGGVAGAIWTGVDPQTGRPRRSRKAALFLGLFVLSFGAWLLALWLA